MVFFCKLFGQNFLVQSIATAYYGSKRSQLQPARKPIVPPIKHFNVASDIAFRLRFSLVFVVGGMGHFGNKQAMLSNIEAASLGHLADLFGPPDVLMR